MQARTRGPRVALAANSKGGATTSTPIRRRLPGNVQALGVATFFDGLDAAIEFFADLPRAFFLRSLGVPGILGAQTGCR